MTTNQLPARLSPLLLGVCVLLVGVSTASAQTTWNVPDDVATIQAALAAAADGDTVRVAPGVYAEAIDFLGKTVTVESTSGPDVTVIDAMGRDTVVRISASPDQTPVLRGFTIRGGDDYNSLGGGGIFVYGGPALIEDNHIVGNVGCPGGINAYFSSATIRHNIISDNQPRCTGGEGGGISIGGAGAVRLLDNVISRNVSGGDGGGIGLNAAGQPLIAGNVIVDNAAGGGSGGSGGGISLSNASDAVIVNNIIARNDAFAGGGIYWLVPSGQQGPSVINNTIAYNTAVQGSAVFADGYDAGARLTNNVLVGGGGAAVIECGDFNDTNAPILTFNDVFHADGGTRYGGICRDRTRRNGNISADPLFVDAAAGDFHLRNSSPAVDAAANAYAPEVDLDGDARPIDGNGNGSARADMGADEAVVGVARQRLYITTPNVPLRWGVGTSQRLSWTYAGKASQFLVEISRDSGKTWAALRTVDNAPGNSQNFNWQVAGPLTSGGKFRVSAVGDPGAVDINDANIRIARPTIEIILPENGNSFAVGTPLTVFYKHSLGARAPITIEVSANNGVTWRTIAQTATTGSVTGSFVWDVDTPPTAHARVRVRAGDGTGVKATSRAFTVVAGAIAR